MDDWTGVGPHKFEYTSCKGSWYSDIEVRKGSICILPIQQALHTESGRILLNLESLQRLITVCTILKDGWPSLSCQRPTVELPLWDWRSETCTDTWQFTLGPDWRKVILCEREA